MIHSRKRFLTFLIAFCFPVDWNFSLKGKKSLFENYSNQNKSLYKNEWLMDELRDGEGKTDVSKRLKLRNQSH